MSPDELSRLVTLEVEMKAVKASLANIEANTDKLVKAYDIGEGAWRAIMKLGGIGLLLIGAAAWLFDHVPLWLKGH